MRRNLRSKWIRAGLYGGIALIALLGIGFLYTVPSPPGGSGTPVHQRVAAGAAGERVQIRTGGALLRAPGVSRARYRSCKASGFKGKACKGAAALDRDLKTFLADCRKADVVGRGRKPCVTGADDVAKTYLSCRFAGRTDRQCESLAVHEACVYRGAGLLCKDAVPIYADCRSPDANGVVTRRSICVEGNIEYEYCRYAWGVTVSGDVCMPATAVYQTCRRASPVAECEARRDEYARTHHQ
ncbi:hypothetical protein [Nonomuraea sp. NPDC049480]|uniref:hypothetical protein n=1 Tax=Nonomuraea sp. NPDC049480 TaxID=3364353 RepID=UPI0037874BE8